MDYKDIKVLKRGQSGFGYLIESDAGYISPDEPRNQPFINEIKKLYNQIYKFLDVSK